LTPADESNHIDKHAFKVPFVCGCRNLGEALRRINEGAAMMRTKGEAGTGNIVEAVRQLRDVLAEIRRLQGLREDELFVAAKELGAPYDLVKGVAHDGKLPVVNFVAGGNKGGTPLDFLNKFHDRISSFHLKDRTSPEHCSLNLAWGTGDTPIEEILQLVSKNKWKIPASIELEYNVPEGSDAVKEVRKCVEYCRAALA
jgi:hypothetical protein